MKSMQDRARTISVRSATEGRAHRAEHTATSSGCTRSMPSSSLDLKATRADVLKAIEGHILAEGRLIGKYTRGKGLTYRRQCLFPFPARSFRLYRSTVCR